ncbi:MAG: RHS repeat protein [Planctomycetes bacterium]|nr:RHS repeat protein [Planctomycetota bacterium]
MQTINDNNHATLTIYDTANRRVVTQTDDNGNTTTYIYDGLNRKVIEAYADCTANQFTFDPHDNNIFWTDGNENQVTQTYDNNDRLVRRDVIPGPGVSDDTTFEVYKYDGLSRLTWAEDDDTLVTRQYDSLSRVTRETQNLFDGCDRTWPTAVVTSDYDGVGNMLTLGYPSGRVITTTYDELERKKTIVDTTNPGQPEPIATYWFVGPGRVAQREYGNGTRSEWTYDGITGVANPPNDFGVKRIMRTNHYRISDGETIDDRTYTWDRMSNKTQRRDIRTDGAWTPRLQHDYQYDNVYRLVQSDKSDPTGPIETIQYILDGVGNRSEVIGGPDAGVYTMDASLCEPADRQLNQYTTTSGRALRYAGTGFLLEWHNDRFVPDFRDRVVETSRGQAQLRYDAIGRRALTKSYEAPCERIVYTATWQELEITRSQGQVEVETRVHGRYLDDMVQIVVNTVRIYSYRDDLSTCSA